MDFREAEERFRQLEMQLRIRRITLEQYRAALAEVRVTDAQGRLWMLQERTGQWHVYDGTTWVPATPPPPVGPPPPPPPPAAGAGPAAGPARQGGGCGGIALYLAIWGVAWVVIAVAVFLWKGQEEPMILAGVGAAALLSLVLMLPALLSSWEGQIVEVRNERVRVPDGEDDWRYENQAFAYVRERSGRTRKVRAASGWKAGDWLAKRRGDPRIHKV